MKLKQSLRFARGQAAGFAGWKACVIPCLIVGMLLVLLLSACGPQTPATPTARPTAVEATPVKAVAAEGNAVTAASGLQYIEIKKGDGPAPKLGEVVSVNYRGFLEDGTQFDNSYDRGQPFRFALGKGMVIPGWDEGIALMSVGGKAKLIIPPELAYGATGASGVIPPNATLIFEVELMDVQPGSPEAPTKVDESDYTVTASGLKFYDLKVGSGLTPTAGQQVTVDYTGWLTDGTKFDSSIDRAQTFSFALGTGKVIPGWDEGVATMQVGGKRQLVIPSTLAYGEKGAGGVIPPNATLIFEVELLSAK